MSDKKYPAIFQPEYDSEIKVLVYGQYDGDNAVHLEGRHKGVKTNYFVNDELKNITRKYLANTYGKCESQEHTDFICELAGKHGFEVLRSGYKLGVFEWFSFYGNKLVFNSEFNAKKYDDSKLIHLPLPPKENEMPEVKKAIATISPKPNNTNYKAFDAVEANETSTAFEGLKLSGERFHCHKDCWSVEFKGRKDKETPEAKPIYTEEMHERGERPPIGSEVVIRYNFDSKTVTHRGEILFISNTNIILCKDGRDIHYHARDYTIEPIPTIEDGVFEVINDHIPAGWDFNRELAVKLLEKYNITPKGGK